MMIHNASTSRSAFSMIEMVLVVVIMGIIVAIAAPKFADAESGRKLSSAKNIVERDIQTIKLRARATGKQHIIAFYPDDEMYVCFEGSDIDRDAIVFARILTDDPINVELSRTNIGGDENIVVSAFGELEQDFTLGVLNNGTEIAISFVGTGFTRGTVNEVDSPADIATETAQNVLSGLGLDLGLGLGKSGK
jgi:prepilin-type N-terminal cleavage/methylation domain-containing protein